MNNHVRPWYYSTWFIIVMFFVCWPIAIGLLIFRNKNIAASGKKTLFMGTTDRKKYIIVGIVMALVGLVSIKDHTFMGIALIAGGVALYFYSTELAKRSERNKKYIELVVNQGETSIDNIAGVCNTSYDKAAKELRILQEVGVLENVLIDEVARTIVLNKSQPVVNEPSEIDLGGIFGKPAEMVTCTCSGCGAKVAIPRGKTVNCEYCDSPITAQ